MLLLPKYGLVTSSYLWQKEQQSEKKFPLF